MSSDDSRPVAPPRTLAAPPPADEATESRSNGSNTAARRQSTEAPTEQHRVVPSATAPAGEAAQGKEATVPSPTPGESGTSGASGASAPPQETDPGAAASAGAASQQPRSMARTRTVRRAKLRLMRVDPWSVTKSAFLLSIAFGIMCVVAVFLIFSIMNAAGLWDSVNETIQGLINQSPEEAFDINEYVGMSRVLGITMLIAAIDVVILTALATLAAFLYNMSASLLGGVEVTLAEDLK